MIIILSLTYSVDMTIFLSAAILISGIIFTARLVLNTHTLLQLVAGYLVGAVGVIGLMFQLLF